MSDVALTTGQSTALEELRRLSSPGTVSIVGGPVAAETGLRTHASLNTTTFDRVAGGLKVEPRELLVIIVTPGFPWVPPQVSVEHHRWAGFPHVLQGNRLCLYLDPATEWDPTSGITGFLERLWNWFADAVANRFDPKTALYQPVGGVLHRTDGAPTIVVTDAVDDLSDGFRVETLALRPRTEHRIDVIASVNAGAHDNSFPGLLVVLSDGLPFGGGLYLSDLAVAIRGQDSRKQRKQFLTAVGKVTRALPADGHLQVIVAVPNKHLSGQARFHLIGWRLQRSLVSKAVEATNHRHQPESPHPDDEPRVEWTYIDDIRTAVTTRHDRERPINWFEGKATELWGCGALGSWIAESLVRAGASKITLRDTGYVTAGLLVRQNFTELDIGRQKVAALADRLRAISDRVVVIERHGLAQAAVLDSVGADAIIDCTVNTGVAVFIDKAQVSGVLRSPVVQIATDNDSATLGIVTVSTGSPTSTTNAIDNAVRETVAADQALVPYLAFWNRDNHPPLTPTLGCSVPTFHGAAADASAIAAQAISLASTALERGLSAGYLLGAAHSPYSVPRIVAVAPSDERGRSVAKNSESIGT